MRCVLRFIISLLLIGSVPAGSVAAGQAVLTQQLARCAVLGNDRQRLACYDEIARKVSSGAEQPQDLIPPASFLESRLVAVPWKEEYHLTVRSFVELISLAVMDSGKHVTVQGWSRDKHDYVLHITMRTPVKLHFFPRQSANDSTQMSLLREVRMDGHNIAAGQFIMIVAAMVPD